MTYNISLDAYAPVISEQVKAEEILQTIKDCKPSENIVVIDFSKIVSMTTTSAKLIFGELYKTLGPTSFAEHIVFSNVSDDVYYIIKLGIKHYISTFGF